MLLEITEWLYSIVVEHAIFFFVYAFTLFFLLRDGLLKTLLFSGVYVAAAALRYCVLMWLGYIKLWASAVNLLSEMIQYAAVVVVCLVCVHSFRCVYRVMKKSHARIGTPCPGQLHLVYPNKTDVIARDPFKMAAAIIGVGFGAIRVTSRIILDVTIGLPADEGEVLNMVIWYSVDILIGFAAYFIVLWIIKFLSRRETKENG